MGESRRRLRSSTVALGSMGLVAVAITSCSSDPDRRCVDRSSLTYEGYKVVADRECKGGTAAGGARAGSGKRTGTSGRNTSPAWYYDADVQRGYASNGTFVRSEAVERGGFGCSGGSGGG
jgi:hypothetical protein